MLLVFSLSNQCQTQLAIVSTAQQQEDSLVQLEKQQLVQLLLANMHMCWAQPNLVEITPAEELHWSPHTKRACTFAVAVKKHKDVSDMEVDSIRQPVTSNASSAPSTVQLESFQVTSSEQSAVNHLNETLFSLCVEGSQCT